MRIYDSSRFTHHVSRFTNDVIIIGGGVIGAATAYYLSKRNIKTILVEKNDLASGTSGACDGCIFMQSKKPGRHLELALQSAKLYQTLPDELDCDIGYKKSGGMILIESEEQLATMRQFTQQQQNAGLEVELLGIEDALKIERHLSPQLVGATYSPMDAQVDPLSLTFAFAAAAKRLGAQILTDTEVTSIAVKNGKAEGVQTNSGKIAAEIIINAAGVYAPFIGMMVGVEIPIIPRRGQILVTEPLPPLINCIMLCACYIAAKFKVDWQEGKKARGQEGKVDSHLTDDSQLGVGTVLEQHHASNILLGSTREFVGYDRRVTIEGMRAIAHHAKNILPILSNVHIIRSFAGLRPYTSDGLPFLGYIGGPEGFLVAAGHEGDGIALAPITGKLLADCVEKRNQTLL
ncbi:FAD-binding oxidoreductase [Candidatus Poribacteria bacterium]|nr:FAD-binding oxidoreductase [Candidatus Poribacteria bacterium]